MRKLFTRLGAHPMFQLRYFGLWHGLTLTSLIGLIAWIILWNGWLTSYQIVPRWLELILLLAPLLALLRGVIYARHKTLVYTLVTSLFYATMGLWYVLEPPEEVYGYVILVLCSGLYVGGYITAKLNAQRETEAQKA